jgi:beta-N-acetylhexosaminidase
MYAAILTLCGTMTLTSCSNHDEPVVPPTDEVEAQLQQMTLREKVGQMFYIRLESLDPSIEWTTYDDLANIKILEVTEQIKAMNEHYPVGGIILYAWNIDDEAQLARIIPQVRKLNGDPLLCIDEE